MILKTNRHVLGGGHGSAAEAPFEKDRPPTGFLGILLVLLVVVLFVVGLIAGELLRIVNDEHVAQVNARYENRALLEQRALDTSRLSDYARHESGTFAVPIDKAKQILLQRGSVAPLR